MRRRLVQICNNPWKTYGKIGPEQTPMPVAVPAPPSDEAALHALWMERKVELEADACALLIIRNVCHRKNGLLPVPHSIDFHNKRNAKIASSSEIRDDRGALLPIQQFDEFTRPLRNNFMPSFQQAIDRTKKRIDKVAACLFCPFAARAVRPKTVCKAI
jgi:hypothetical protein